MRFTCLLLLFCGVLSAQTPQDTVKYLPSVQIVEPKARYAVWMREVEGLSICASKKSDVVLPSNTDAHLATNQVRQVFGKVAGLNVWENDGSGIQTNIAVRGLSPNRSWEFNVRQNGYDISADNFGYPEAYYAPPLEAVQRVELIRGATALQYGPQTGGLLHYRLKSAPKDRKIAIESRQTIGSFGLFNTFNAIGGSAGKWSYHGYIHYRKGEGWRDNSAFRIGTGHFNAAYSFRENIRLSAEITRSNYIAQQAGGVTDAQFALDARQSSRQRNWFSAPWTLYAAHLDWQLSTHTQWQTCLFGLDGQRNSIGFIADILTKDTINRLTEQYNARQLDRFHFKNIGLESRLLHSYTLWGQEHALSAGVRIFKGGQQRQQRGRGDGGTQYNLHLQAPQYPFDMSFDTRNYAVFAENLLRYGRFALVPGVRYESISSHSQGRINTLANGTSVVATPQTRVRHLLLAGIGTEVHLYEHTEIYANVCNAYRPVMHADLVPAATSDVIDPALKDARTLTTDLGVRGQWHKWLRFDLNVFYLRHTRRIGVLNQLHTDGNTYLFRTNLGQSASYGTEMYAEIYPFKAFSFPSQAGECSLFAALSWTRARYGEFKVSTLKNGQVTYANLAGHAVEYAPAYIHRMGCSYQIKGFSTTFTVSKVAGVFTDANNTKIPTANGQAGWLAGYTLLDWSATVRLHKHWGLAFGLNNLADVRYATRRASGYPGPGLLPGDGRSAYATITLNW